MTVLLDPQLIAIGILGGVLSGLLVALCALALPGHDLRIVCAVFLGLVGLRLVGDAAVSR